MDRIEAIELTEDARHRFGEVSKERPQPNQISLGGVLGGEGCEIGVAGQTIRPDRHRQECPPWAEHGRPGVNRAGDNRRESPAHLAKMPRRDVAKERVSNREWIPSAPTTRSYVPVEPSVTPPGPCHRADSARSRTCRGAPGRRRCSPGAHDEAHHERCQRTDRRRPTSAPVRFPPAVVRCAPGVAGAPCGRLEPAPGPPAKLPARDAVSRDGTSRYRPGATMRPVR